MARLVEHGGHCCGARHIYGFSDNDRNDVISLRECVRQAPAGRMLEVILNGTQVQNKPLLLAELARLGFVLSNHWINNNHGSDNYQFVRCDRRRPLTNLPFVWTGQVITPDTRGELPLNGAGAVNGLAAPVTAAPDARGRRVGASRYRIDSPTSRRHQGIYVLQAVGHDNLYFDDDDGRFGILIDNCNFIDHNGRQEPVQAPAQDPADLPMMRHEQPDVNDIAGERVIERRVEVPVPAPVVLVASFYHNVYGRSGRSPAPHPTLASAQAVRGVANVVRIDRRDLMSDGTEVWVEELRI